jgi:putative transposase
VKRYQLGAHTKHDLKVHLVWIPKYRKKVLTGQVVLRARDLIRQIAMEHEISILSEKVASDHIHVLVAYRPHVDISRIVQWLKGISSRILLQEFAYLRKAFWGRHLWARGIPCHEHGKSDRRDGARLILRSKRVNPSTTTVDL